MLQPIGFMVVFSLIFGNVAGISSERPPLPLFSLSALVPWTFFSTALLLGSDSLVSNSALVSKIYFPRIFMPAGVIVAGFVDLAISLRDPAGHRPRLGLRALGGDPGRCRC